VRPAPRCLGILAVGALALAASLGSTPGLAHAQSDGYLDHAALGAAITSLAASSDAASVETIGTSIDGRDVWMVTIGAPGGAPLDQRPGVLIVGNLEGDHLVGSSLAVETIRYLLGSDDEAVAEAIANNVFYIVPRLNPDGAEAMFAAVHNERRGNGRPHDDDNDGRTDEDSGDDLNGDGMVTLMRVADPYGAYMVDPDEPRLMKRADAAKGESGAYAVYVEGRDDDGDGFYNEDGGGGVDLNRNFQHAYPYWKADAGAHMISEPETRALMDFVIAHRNIGAMLTFGHSDNLVTAPDGQGNLGGFATSDLAGFAAAANADVYDVGVFGQQQGGFGGFGGFFFGGGRGGPRLRGAQLGRNNDPASGRRPETSVNRADLEYFKAVSEAYKEITGISAVGINREPEGALFQYGYYQFGVPSFSTQGWGLPAAEAEGEAADDAAAAAPAAPAAPGPMARGRFRGGRGGPASSPGGSAAGGGADAKVLTALDGAGIDAFVEWTPFEHPQLGAVEIGGFRPYAATHPPAEQLAELGAQHGRFAARLAGMLPSVSIVNTEVTAHGGGIYTVTAEIQNSGYFPTALAHAVSARAVAPVTVQIGVDPEHVLTGAAKSATTATLAGSGGREKFSWVIRGNGGDSVEIRLITQKGGRDSATVSLR